MGDKRLIILSELDLNNPAGASWNRVLCYSRALADSNVKVIITSAVYENLNSLKLIEYAENIFILRSEKKINRKKQLPVIKELHLIKHIQFLRFVYKKFHRNNDTTYLLYPLNFSLNISTLVYLRFLKLEKVFLEKNELKFGQALNLPFPRNILKMLIFPIVWILNMLVSLTSDVVDGSYTGMICISTRMEKLYRKLNKNIIRIPILAYPAKTSSRNVQIINKDSFRIAYSGSISENKDGVFSLIKTIPLIIKSKSNIIVNLYGPISNKGKLALNAFIDENNLSDIIRYHGDLPADKIPRILRAHNLLILLRPSNPQTNYGFSTKLAEYLASGIPVLSTDVSDVGKYLSNNENAFLVSPGNINIFKKKIIEIIEMKPTRLAQIGRKGQEIVKIHFNIEAYKDQLLWLLFNIKTKVKT